MYSDLSVTVSADVVRTMDKAFSSLVLIEEGYVSEPGRDHETIARITEAIVTLEKLFVWRDELLVDRGEYELWCCRELAWIHIFKELVRTHYEETPRDFVQTGTDAGRKLVEQDYWDEENISYLIQACQDLSESIWEHFVGMHYLAELEA